MAPTARRDRGACAFGDADPLANPYTAAQLPQYRAGRRLVRAGVVVAGSVVAIAGGAALASGAYADDFGGDFGSSDFGSDFGSSDFGSASLGSTDFGSASLGSTDFGSASLGSSDSGSAGLGSSLPSSSGSDTVIDFGGDPVPVFQTSSSAPSGAVDLSGGTSTFNAGDATAFTTASGGTDTTVSLQPGPTGSSPVSTPVSTVVSSADNGVTTQPVLQQVVASSATTPVVQDQVIQQPVTLSSATQQALGLTNGTSTNGTSTNATSTNATSTGVAATGGGDSSVSVQPGAVLPAANTVVSSVVGSGDGTAVSPQPVTLSSATQQALGLSPSGSRSGGSATSSGSGSLADLLRQGAGLIVASDTPSQRGTTQAPVSTPGTSTLIGQNGVAGQPSAYVDTTVPGVVPSQPGSLTAPTSTPTGTVSSDNRVSYSLPALDTSSVRLNANALGVDGVQANAGRIAGQFQGGNSALAYNVTGDATLLPTTVNASLNHGLSFQPNLATAGANISLGGGLGTDPADKTIIGNYAGVRYGAQAQPGVVVGLNGSGGLQLPYQVGVNGSLGTRNADGTGLGVNAEAKLTQEGPAVAANVDYNTKIGPVALGANGFVGTSRAGSSTDLAVKADIPIGNVSISPGYSLSHGLSIGASIPVNLPILGNVVLKPSVSGDGFSFSFGAPESTPVQQQSTPSPVIATQPTTGQVNQATGQVNQASGQLNQASVLNDPTNPLGALNSIVPSTAGRGSQQANATGAGALGGPQSVGYQLVPATGNR